MVYPVAVIDSAFRRDLLFFPLTDCDSCLRTAIKGNTLAGGTNIVDFGECRGDLPDLPWDFGGWAYDGTVALYFGVTSIGDIYVIDRFGTEEYFRTNLVMDGEIIGGDVSFDTAYGMGVYMTVVKNEYGRGILKYTKLDWWEPGRIYFKPFEGPDDIDIVDIVKNEHERYYILVKGDDGTPQIAEGKLIHLTYKRKYHGMEVTKTVKLDGQWTPAGITYFYYGGAPQIVLMLDQTLYTLPAETYDKKTDGDTIYESELKLFISTNVTLSRGLTGCKSWDTDIAKDWKGGRRSFKSVPSKSSRLPQWQPTTEMYTEKPETTFPEEFTQPTTEAPAHRLRKRHNIWDIYQRLRDCFCE